METPILKMWERISADTPADAPPQLVEGLRQMFFSGFLATLMSPEEIAAKIEEMFDSQLDGHELTDALELLQIQLIGAAEVEAMRAERHRKYQEAHPWMFPEIYPDAVRPVQNQILTPRVMTEEMGKILAESLKGSW